MYDKNNIFAKILRNEIPCEKVYEDEHSLFFRDINPQAKIHVLGIPKSPCLDFTDFLSNSDEKLISSFFKSLHHVIDLLGVKETGYRIISNSGNNGGQEVPHFHFHILAGEQLGSINK
tara:strand:+ start:182 stop:535 length:354 start_codon:yes stop_codon:yes gene_type:complete